MSEKFVHPRHYGKVPQAFNKNSRSIHIPDHGADAPRWLLGTFPQSHKPCY